MEKKATDAAKTASEKAAFFLRSFRDKAQTAASKAQTAASHGGHMTSKLVAQVRSKAETVNNTVYKQGVRISQYASSSVPSKSSSSKSSKPPPRLSTGAVSMAVPAFVSAGAAAYLAEDEKVKSLCALGFSPPVVRHALRRCDGDVERTGLWLLDEAHRDERLAAELEGGELSDGAFARINGLRGAIHLNGIPVVLQFYDEETQRWIVQMPDGTAKSIRPRNLDRLDDEAAAVAASEVESSMKVLGSEAPKKSSNQPNRLEEQLANVLEEVELRKQVREMIGILTGTEEDEALKALSVQELLEVMRSLPEQARAEEAERLANLANSALCGPADSKERAVESGQLQPAQQGVSASMPEKDDGLTSDSPKRKVSEAAASELRELERKLKESSDKLNLWEAQQIQQQKALEAREAELLENQERWRGEAAIERNADAASGSNQVRELEQKLKESADKMTLWEAEQLQQQKALEAREAELLESQERWRGEAEAKAEQIQLLQRREEAQQQAVEQLESREEAQASVSHEQPSEAETEAAAQLQEQLAELRVLQAKAESAAEDLENMKAKAEVEAQELERRQQAQRQSAEDRELRLLEQEAEQIRVGKALEEEQERLQQQRRAVLLLQQSLALPVSPMTSDGNVQCIEMPLDDSACTTYEEAAPEAADLSAGAEKFGNDAVVFKPPRRSVAGKQRHDPDLDNQASSDAQEDGRECGESDEDDEEEEVWDLDWSMVSTKLTRRASQSTESDGSPMRSNSRGASDENLPGPSLESQDEHEEEIAPSSEKAKLLASACPEMPVDPTTLAMKEKLAARQKLCTDATEDSADS